MKRYLLFAYAEGDDAHGPFDRLVKWSDDLVDLFRAAFKERMSMPMQNITDAKVQRSEIIDRDTLQTVADVFHWNNSYRLSSIIDDDEMLCRLTAPTGYTEERAD